MREAGTYGSVRGALSNERPYRDIEFVGRKRGRLVRGRRGQGARS